MGDTKKLFTVTKKDFRIDYYKGRGKGGQKKNKTENCCRITHLESGAVGKSEEGRSKEHNKMQAFRRCTESEKFQNWCKIKGYKLMGIVNKIEEILDREISEENLKIEVISGGEWVEVRG